MSHIILDGVALRAELVESVAPHKGGYMATLDGDTRRLVSSVPTHAPVVVPNNGDTYALQIVFEGDCEGKDVVTEMPVLAWVVYPPIVPGEFAPDALPVLSDHGVGDNVCILLYSPSRKYAWTFPGTLDNWHGDDAVDRAVESLRAQYLGNKPGVAA